MSGHVTILNQLQERAHFFEVGVKRDGLRKHGGPWGLFLKTPQKPLAKGFGQIGNFGGNPGGLGLFRSSGPKRI